MQTPWSPVSELNEHDQIAHPSSSDLRHNDRELLQLKGIHYGQLDLKMNDYDDMTCDDFGVLENNLKDAPPPYFEGPSQHIPGHAIRQSTYGPNVPIEYLRAYHSPLRLNIVVHIVGSRGDVAPFIPIAQSLSARGHRVRIATHVRFAAWVRSFGLEFYTLGADPEMLMAFMVKNGGLIPSIRSVAAGDIQKNRAELDKLIRGAYLSCTEPDEETGHDFIAHTVIAHPASFGSPHAAEALGVPIQLFSPMPWAPTSAFPHPFTNVETSGNYPKFANLLTYEAVHQMTWAGCRDLVNATREEHGLSYATAGSVSAGMALMPQTYLISPSILPPPADYGDLVEVTGFCFQQPQGPVGELSPEIVSFLESGPPPVYCGFGSIVGFDLALLYTQFIQAVTWLRLRAIVCTGWGNVAVTPSDNVLVIKECSHDLLLPHCAAVCHHGGAGTTAAGLRHGKPTMVVSFFGDQPFWGRLVASRGAGPLPVNARACTLQSMITSLNTCMRADVQVKAAELAALIGAEQGAESAVHSFLSRVPWDCMASDLDSNQVAEVMHTPTKRKLSVLEAQILVLAGVVTAKSLERYRAAELSFGDQIDGSINLVGTVAEGFVNGYVKAVKHSRAGLASGNKLQIAKGVGSIVYHPVKGVFGVVGNLATGFSRAQRMYDPTFRPAGRVTDFKSGAVQGLKSFAVNMGGACTDIFVKPVVLARKEGFSGAMKGFAIGAMNMNVKFAVGGLDLIVLPCKGLYRGMKQGKSQDLLGRTLKPSDFGKAAAQGGAIAQELGCPLPVVEATLRAWSALG